MWRDNPAISTILARRSVRQFDPRPVEEEKVNLILECGHAAPSAYNVRPWHFVVIDDRKVLNAIADAHPFAKMLYQAPLAIAICAEIGDKEITKRYWEEDCSAAMENILLAATALGLGSVWIGVAHVGQPKEVIRKLLGVPPEVEIHGIAAIGYPPQGFKVQPHSGVDPSKVHRNRW